jgi:hypothetical protein
MSTLASLKKGSSLEKLTKALQQTNQKSGKDDRYWQPEVDKSGNGFAIIRFLDSPAVDGDDGMPWVQMFSHGFQGPGGWYIENSLTTIGKEDPVSEYNSKLWKTEVEANKEIARKQKRRLSYISNILVIKDSAHPENEGKIFLFSYGKKIFDKIKSKIDPTDEEKGLAEKEGIELTAVNVFSFWEGYNFKLKIRQVEGYRNYDLSSFDDKPSAIAKSDAEIEKIWKAAYSLKALLAPEQFKSYEVLEARLNKVLGLAGETPVSKAPLQTKAVEETDDTPPFEPTPNPQSAKTVQPKAEVKKPAPKADKPKVEVPAEDEEDNAMLSMFKNLAEQE